MADSPNKARQEFDAWREMQPSNFYTDNHQLRRIVRSWMAGAATPEREAQLTRFGAIVAGELDDAAIENNLARNLPVLERYDGMGKRVEAVSHHPSYEICGRAIYQDGRVIAAYGEAAPNLYAQTAFYVSSHVGEAGHNCPVACTAGIAKVLAEAASDELRDKWLPGVLTDQYIDRLDGAQFLTEVQGGSDVGANAVVAKPDGEAFGTTRWRIHGEKWFCSNADADLILMTARYEGGPAGTRGLGLFLVPRRLEDGTLNHFAVRRLKDKLGTRSMPSGEIDFDGTVAYAIGPVERGFSVVMKYVITTSRLYNTVGCAGIARRAYEIAAAYAAARTAFGTPVLNFPQMQVMIATMRAGAQAMTAGALFLAHRFDTAETKEDRAFTRVAANLVKMRSCQHSHRLVQIGIETLAGNGAIETFSILPRLLRDNVVYENWEGTHNTLVAQSFRDFAKHKLHVPLLTGIETMLEGCDAKTTEVLAPAIARVEHIRRRLPAILQAEPGVGSMMLRPHLEDLADIVFAVAFGLDLSNEPDRARRNAELEVLAWFLSHHGADRPEVDEAYCARAGRVARLSG